MDKQIICHQSKSYVWRKLGAEFLGTAFMVGAGCGSIALGWSNGAISLTFGVAVCIAIFVFGPISGAHINPAVTLGFWYNKQLESKLVAPYIFAQLLGGLSGALLSGGVGPTTPQPGVGQIQLIGIEILITFLLMMSIFWVVFTQKLNHYIAIWVGLTVAILAFLFGPYTGASMNPARTFGPNALSGELNLIPIYIISCCIGALTAAMLMNALSSKKQRDNDMIDVQLDRVP